MFNRDTESSLKSRHNDAARMRRRNGTIPGAPPDGYRGGGFWYGILRGTQSSKIEQRKPFVNDLSIKGVKIYDSIEALMKPVRASNIKVSLFHCTLMSSLRMIIQNQGIIGRIQYTGRPRPHHYPLREGKRGRRNGCPFGRGSRFLIAQRRLFLLQIDYIVATAWGLHR